MAESAGPRTRPLSPHLQIYRWQGTMLMSILHRLTGAGLYFGMALVVLWLGAAALSPPAFDLVNAVAGSWPGQIVLLGFTWALIHHALGGLRHFVWDLGYGFGAPARDLLAWGTIALSALLTAAVWALVLWWR